MLIRCLRTTEPRIEFYSKNSLRNSTNEISCKCADTIARGWHYILSFYIVMIALITGLYFVLSFVFKIIILKLNFTIVAYHVGTIFTTCMQFLVLAHHVSNVDLSS